MRRCTIYRRVAATPRRSSVRSRAARPSVRRPRRTRARRPRVAVADFPRSQNARRPPLRATAVPVSEFYKRKNVRVDYELFAPSTPVPPRFALHAITAHTPRPRTSRARSVVRRRTLSPPPRFARQRPAARKLRCATFRFRLLRRIRDGV